MDYKKVYISSNKKYLLTLLYQVLYKRYISYNLISKGGNKCLKITCTYSRFHRHVCVDI